MYKFQREDAMKKLLTPLIAGTLLFATTGTYAQGYSDDKIDDIIYEMDDNGDRKVRFDEYFEETVTDNNDSFDVNKDGYITSGEVVLEIKEDLVQSIKEMRKQGMSEKAINKTIASELNAAEKDAEALIKKMDADGDNLVEPDELKAYKKRKFRALDKNRDGFISVEDASKSRRMGSSKKRNVSAKGYSYVPYNP